MKPVGAISRRRRRDQQMAASIAVGIQASAASTRSTPPTSLVWGQARQAAAPIDNPLDVTSSGPSGDFLDAPPSRTGIAIGGPPNRQKRLSLVEIYPRRTERKVRTRSAS